MLGFVVLASVVLSQCDTFVNWKDLSHDQKRNYVKAVMLLSEKQSLLRPHLNPNQPVAQRLVPNGHPLPKSRLDDFTYARMRADGNTNNLLKHPQYLPWHRVFLRLFDTALRNEGGYRDPLPYWDISADYNSEPDILHYFGSDQNWLLRLGDKNALLPASIPNEHSVSRGPIGPATLQFNPKVVGPQLQIARVSYDSLRALLRNYQEDALRALNGDVKLFATASNDPVFYLLLRNTDRLWYQSQMSDARIGSNYGGSWGRTQVAKTDKMQFFGLSVDIAVKDVLQPKNNALPCYQYAEPAMATRRR